MIDNDDMQNFELLRNLNLFQKRSHIDVYIIYDISSYIICDIWYVIFEYIQV